jgi:hypothetical protein
MAIGAGVTPPHIIRQNDDNVRPILSLHNHAEQQHQRSDKYSIDCIFHFSFNIKAFQ